jgi:hypothetical protein
MDQEQRSLGSSMDERSVVHQRSSQTGEPPEAPKRRSRILPPDRPHSLVRFIIPRLRDRRFKSYPRNHFQTLESASVSQSFAVRAVILGCSRQNGVCLKIGCDVCLKGSRRVHFPQGNCARRSSTNAHGRKIPRTTHMVGPILRPSQWRAHARQSGNVGFSQGGIVAPTRRTRSGPFGATLSSGCSASRGFGTRPRWERETDACRARPTRRARGAGLTALRPRNAEKIP